MIIVEGTNIQQYLENLTDERPQQQANKTSGRRRMKSHEPKYSRSFGGA